MTNEEEHASGEEDNYMWQEDANNYIEEEGFSESQLW